MTDKILSNPSDRDLLALAAKAVGGLVCVPDMGWIEQDADGNRGAWWNPLKDDGQAFRLLALMNFDVMQHRGVGESPRVEVIGNEATFRQPWAVEGHGADPCCALRRAIVRAVATIGAAK